MEIESISGEEIMFAFNLPRLQSDDSTYNVKKILHDTTNTMFGHNTFWLFTFIIIIIIT